MRLHSRNHRRIRSMATPDSVELAAEVVAAFISNNPLPRGELPALIQTVHSAVERLGKGLESAPPQVEMKSPAVPIRKSVTPDYLICLEDGKKFKSLRRHLAGHGPHASPHLGRAEGLC